MSHDRPTLAQCAGLDSLPRRNESALYGAVMRLDEDGSPEDPGAAKKLLKFILGTKKWFDQYLLSVVRPIALYKARGKYDGTRSSLLARHLVTMAGRAYSNGSDDWHKQFGQATRETAERLVRDAGEKDAASRKYDNLLPAKYQKDFQGYGKSSA